MEIEETIREVKKKYYPQFRYALLDRIENKLYLLNESIGIFKMQDIYRLIDFEEV